MFRKYLTDFKEVTPVHLTENSLFLCLERKWTLKLANLMFSLIIIQACVSRTDEKPVCDQKEHLVAAAKHQCQFLVTHYCPDVSLNWLAPSFIQFNKLSNQAFLVHFQTTPVALQYLPSSLLSHRQTWATITGRDTKPWTVRVIFNGCFLHSMAQFMVKSNSAWP